jgi:hypothetical protein
MRFCRSGATTAFVTVGFEAHVDREGLLGRLLQHGIM